MASSYIGFAEKRVPISWPTDTGESPPFSCSVADYLNHGYTSHSSVQCTLGDKVLFCDVEDQSDDLIGVLCSSRCCHYRGMCIQRVPSLSPFEMCGVRVAKTGKASATLAFSCILSPPSFLKWSGEWHVSWCFGPWLTGLTSTSSLAFLPFVVRTPEVSSFPTAHCGMCCCP